VISGGYVYKPYRYSSHTLLLEHFPAPGQGRRVLDVGGGEGYLSEVLASRGYSVVCVARPGSARADFPREVELLEADLDLDLPEPGLAFDCVLCGDILEHLRDPLRALQWLRGLMRPSGRVVASLPNSGHLYFRGNVLLGRFPAHDRGLFDRTHLHYFAWENWRRLFTDAGLSIESVKPTAVPIALALGSNPAGLAVRALESLSYALGLIRKTLFAYQFVVVARPENRPLK
jgi:SAM-dependent methyltransferase